MARPSSWRSLLPAHRAALMAVIGNPAAAGRAGRTARAGRDLLGLADAAARCGATLVDCGAAGPDVIAAVRARHPRLLLCGADPAADVLRDAQAARAGGAALICADAAAAASSGLPPGRLLVSCSPTDVSAVSRAGLAALVDADEAAAAAYRAAGGPGPDGAPSFAALAAVAALSCWQGAAVVATCHPAVVARALDMAASIRGARPPARAQRGLG